MRGAASSAYPQHKRRVRPGWKATIVRSESFARLRAIQKSTIDPAIDLSYLADACLQMALDIGARGDREARVGRPAARAHQALTLNLSMEHSHERIDFRPSSRAPSRKAS